MQRKSVLSAKHFVDMLMFANKPSDQLSLEDLANDFCEQHGISISKQALHERFNDFSVSFMKDLLKRQLGQLLAKFLWILVNWKILGIVQNWFAGKRQALQMQRLEILQNCLQAHQST
ncbi:MAG: hypothetical protein KF763_01095 [Cyclobacteriaceae bacterium]|nr:hypothetical protein [Cyclobacteriaceae bacterium]